MNWIEQHQKATENRLKKSSQRYLKFLHNIINALFGGGSTNANKGNTTKNIIKESVMKITKEYEKKQR